MVPGIDRWIFCQLLVGGGGEYEWGAILTPKSENFDTLNLFFNFLPLNLQHLTISTKNAYIDNIVPKKCNFG